MPMTPDYNWWWRSSLPQGLRHPHTTQSILRLMLPSFLIPELVTNSKEIREEFRVTGHSKIMLSLNCLLAQDLKIPTPMTQGKWPSNTSNCPVHLFLLPHWTCFKDPSEARLLQQPTAVSFLIRDSCNSAFLFNKFLVWGLFCGVALSYPLAPDCQDTLVMEITSSFWFWFNSKTFVRVWFLSQNA